MIKKIITAMLVFAITISFAACNNIDYAPDSVVIYMEYNGALGTQDNEVKRAIEEKFKADTGYTIDLVIETAGTSDITTKFTNALDVNSGTRVDGFVYHYSSDSPLNEKIVLEEVKDLAALTKDYAPEFLKYYNNEQYDKNGFSYYAGVFNNKLYALSSAEHTSSWGMIIRKDFMANTSYNPDEYDIASDNYKSLTVNEFIDLLRQLKSNNNTVDRPLLGMTWEVDNLIAPAFNAIKYTHKVLNENGDLVPAYATQEYLKLLKFERQLQEEDLWVENPSATAMDMTQAYISGKGAVHIVWPEVTSQVEIATKLKSAIGQDSIMLAPLIAEGSTVTNGNLRQPSGFMGLIIPYKGENSELLMRYINWLYSDVENYQLAKYGIKGVHWEPAEHKGVKMWKYPDENYESFSKASPYSGKYCLIENINVSEMLYAEYSEQHLAWISKIRQHKSFPENGYDDEGVLLPMVPASNRILLKDSSGHSVDYLKVRTYAWSKSPLPSGQTIDTLWQTMYKNLLGTDADNTGAKYYSIIDFDTRNYYQIVNSRT